MGMGEPLVPLGFDPKLAVDTVLVVVKIVSAIARGFAPCSFDPEVDDSSQERSRLRHACRDVCRGGGKVHRHVDLSSMVSAFSLCPCRLPSYRSSA
jgi:hypothetical protein